MPKGILKQILETAFRIQWLTIPQGAYLGQVYREFDRPPHGEVASIVTKEVVIQNTPLLGYETLMRAMCDFSKFK